MAEEGEKPEGEKEFEASEQKRQKAREDGNIVQSKEASALAVVLGLLIASGVFWTVTGSSISQILFSFFHHADAYGADIFEGGGGQTTSAMGMLGLSVLVPFLVILILVLVLLVATGAIVFSAKKIAPDVKKISPAENLKKKYGPQGLIDFLRDGAKMVVAGVIAAVFLWNFAQNAYGLSAMHTAELGRFTFETIVKLIVAFGIFQLILALIDYPIQVRLHSNRLKMTREEMKKELKQSEGDPELKQQRRAKGAKISRGQMLKDVETSTVVMTNPTHYAVALTWSPESKKAPIVVAKGADHLAAKIREVATLNGVPLHRDPPQTRSIYASVEVGEEILPEHFAAVAAAIQYVNRLKPPPSE